MGEEPEERRRTRRKVLQEVDDDEPSKEEEDGDAEDLGVLSKMVTTVEEFFGQENPAKRRKMK